MANIFDLGDDWTDSGTVYDAIKIDVTDTASDATSKLLDLQVGGASKFKVDKNGNVTSLGDVNGASPSEMSHLSGVSSNIQTQLDAAGGGDMLSTNNLSDVANAATSRTNLGLGTAATNATGDFATASHTHTASDLADFATEVSNNTSVAANTAKVTNVDTNLSTTQTSTTVDVVSSDGTDATLPQAIASGNAGVMSGADKAKLDVISGANTGDNAVNSLYSGLVTNATHTGEVTGDTALLVDKTLISNKTDITTPATDDYVLVGDTSDTNALKKVTAQSIADLGGGGDFLADGSVAMTGDLDVQANVDITGTYQKDGVTILDADPALDSVFLGEAGNATMTGVKGVLIGTSAGAAMTSASHCVAIGYNSQQNNTSGSNNTSIGKEACGFISYGNNNSALGYEAIRGNTSGSGNSGLGRRALYANQAGSNNVAAGNEAVLFLNGGSSNVALGYQAGKNEPNGTDSLVTANNSIFIGAQAKGVESSTNQIVIGDSAIGLGSNTTVLGSTATTQTQIFGGIVLPGLPTADPVNAGELWNDSGTLKVSAG